MLSERRGREFRYRGELTLRVVEFALFETQNLNVLEGSEEMLN